MLSRLGAFVEAARCIHAVLHTSSAVEGGVKILAHVSEIHLTLVGPLDVRAYCSRIECLREVALCPRTSRCRVRQLIRPKHENGTR